MADVDIDPFGEHESRPEGPTHEHIPLDPVTPVGGGQLGNQTKESKKLHLEKNLKEPN